MMNPFPSYFPYTFQAHPSHPLIQTDNCYPPHNLSFPSKQAHTCGIRYSQLYFSAKVKNTIGWAFMSTWICSKIQHELVNILYSYRQNDCSVKALFSLLGNKMYKPLAKSFINEKTIYLYLTKLVGFMMLISCRFCPHTSG